MVYATLIYLTSLNKISNVIVLLYFCGKQYVRVYVNMFALIVQSTNNRNLLTHINTIIYTGIHYVVVYSSNSTQ